MIKIKKTAALVATLCISTVLAGDAFAGGWEGTGDWGSGSVSGGGGGGGSGNATKWIKYNRAMTDSKAFTNDDEDGVPIAPQYRGTLVKDGTYKGGDGKWHDAYYPEIDVAPPYINKECHKTGSGADGVWVLGNVTPTKTSFNNYMNSSYDTVGGNLSLNSIWSAYATAIPVKGKNNYHTTTWIQNGHYSIYRRTGDGDMIYNTLSAQNVSYDKITWGGATAVATIYYGTIGSDTSGNPTYTDTRAYITSSNSAAGSVGTVVNAYVNYMINSGKYSETDITEAKSYLNVSEEKYKEAYEKYIRGNNVFAFCSYPEATETKLDAEVYLEIDGDGVFSGIDKENISTKKTVYSPEVSASTYFNFERGVKTPDMTFNASFVRLNDTSYDADLTFKSEKLNGQQPLSKPDEENGIEKIKLNVGDNVICSSVKHPDKISSGNNSGRAKNEEAKACITVTYEPNVAAIDSQTTVTVGGNSFSSGWDSYNEYDLGQVDYGVNAVTAAWDYDLRANARCKLAKFLDGKRCESNVDTITDSFKVKYMLMGDVANDTSGKTVTLSSPSYLVGLNDEKKTVAYSLLPGEYLEKKQSIGHYAGVRQDGSPANASTGTETSTMVLKGTAKNVVCKINDQEFGLGNPINYGRLSVYKNATTPVTFGDNANSGWSGDIWLRPEDRVQFGYEACLGAQIKKDKENGKGWNDALDAASNITLPVTVTNNWLDDSHYASTNNAVDKNKTEDGGKNIIAYEVLGDTITKHLSADYQFAGVNSHEGKVGNLGRIVKNNFEIRADGTASAILKIPYNYILEPNVGPGSKDIITIGDSNTFTLSISNNDSRINKQVSDEVYHTNIKPNTKASYITFAANTTSTTKDLLKSLDGKFVYGDKTEDILGALGGWDIQNVESGSIDISAEGVANKTVEVSSNKTVEGYNKICVAMAVYPADSHNMQGATEINDDVQFDALTDDFNAAYTRIAVSCKTIGKYPTVSVEGNGIVAGGTVKGATTEFSGRTFGSWTEYGLVANGVVSFGSGASLAYIEPQTEKNQFVHNIDKVGKAVKEIDSLQTLGNIDDTIGLQDDSQASIYAGQAKDFAESIKSTYFTEEREPDAGRSYLADIGNHTFVNAKFKNKIVIDDGMASEIRAAYNSHEDAQVLIYSEQDIVIKNEVTQLFANLITDGKLDTCEEADQTAEGKNSLLMERCYNVLVVTGTVYSENSIALDRVFGGGSSYGSMKLDPTTLVQRAELFIYDPRIIKWGYDYKHKTQPLTTTYIEELSTRY